MLLGLEAREVEVGDEVLLLSGPPRRVRRLVAGEDAVALEVDGFSLVVPARSRVVVDRLSASAGPDAQTIGRKETS